MSVFAHISDLHFGTEDPERVMGLVAVIRRLAPDLVIVSGDLSQRAHRLQFEAAHACLESLKAPCLVVPGNHDLPLWNLGERLLSPLQRYCRHLTQDLTPLRDFPDSLVVGIDTTCRWVWKRGAIGRSHLALLHEQLGSHHDRRLRVVVTHHPFLPAPGAPPFAPMYGRVKEALALLRAHGPALLLSGHLHLADTGEIHATESGSLLAVQAGTAISRRVRTQPNTFNLVQVEPGRITITVQVWDGKEFTPSESRTYSNEKRCWSEAG